MKNTYEFTVTLDHDDDEMCIKERKLYGKKKQSKKKQRQKDFLKSS